MRLTPILPLIKKSYFHQYNSIQSSYVIKGRFVDSLNIYKLPKHVGHPDQSPYRPGLARRRRKNNNLFIHFLGGRRFYWFLWKVFY